jgi:hypothetical protein
MVMVSARLTRRWRLSYRHDLTNAAIAASRVSAFAVRRSRGPVAMNGSALAGISLL